MYLYDDTDALHGSHQDGPWWIIGHLHPRWQPGLVGRETMEEAQQPRQEGKTETRVRIPG